MANRAVLRTDEREMIPPGIREPAHPLPQKKRLASAVGALGLQGPPTVRLDGSNVQNSKQIIRSSGPNTSAAACLVEKV